MRPDFQSDASSECIDRSGTERQLAAVDAEFERIYGEMQAEWDAEMSKRPPPYCYQVMPPGRLLKALRLANERVYGSAVDATD